MRKLEEPTLLTDQVFALIRASIMNGEMPAGYRLRIRDLAAEVGTSVMPVREAIRRLEEAGLAERVPDKGAVVKSLTLSELAHVYDVRRLLEVDAARLGAARIEPADVDRMQQEYDQMMSAVEAGHVVAVLDHDEAARVNNESMLNATARIRDQIAAETATGDPGSSDGQPTARLSAFSEAKVPSEG